MIHGEAILLQPVDDERGDLAVISNYQDAHNSSMVERIRNFCVKKSFKGFHHSARSRCRAKNNSGKNRRP
jgi:hypothetical protein